MAVRIDIPGIGEVEAQNAASEATLRQILKALGGRAGQVGGPSGGGGGGGIDTKKGQEGVDKLGKTSGKASSSVAKLGSAAASVAGGLVNGLVAAVGGAVGAVTGMATGLLEGKSSIHEFTKNIPGLNMVTGVIENQMSMFKELSSVGAGFGNNMFEIAQVAGQSALSMQTLGKIIASESEGLRMFGGNVQDGTRRFGRLSKELRTGDMGRKLLGMGLTTEELNENLISYNELLVSTGRDRYMTDSQIAAGSAAYSLELDKIAKLTGKSRKQIEDEQRAKNTDIRRQAAQSTMTNDQMNKFRNNLSLAAKTSPEFEAALVDMADGIANDPVTRQLMANSPTFEKFAKDIENMSPEEYNNFQKQVGDEMKNLAMKFKDGGIDAAMNSSFGSALQIAGQLAMTVEATEGAVAGQQSAQDKLTTAIANSVTTLEDLSGRTQSLVTQTDAFKEMTDSIANIIPDYQTAVDLFEANKGTIETAMNEAWTWMKTTGKDLLKTAMEGATSAFTSAWNYMKEILPTLQQWATDFSADPAGFFDSAISTLKGWVTDAMILLGTGIVAWFSTTTLAASIGAGLVGLGTTIGTAILGFIGTALTASAGFIATALGTALTAVGGALLSIPALIGAAILTAIGGAFLAIDFAFFDGSMTEMLKEKISGLWTKIKDAVGGLISKLNPFNWFGGDDNEPATEQKKKKDSGSWWNPFDNGSEPEMEEQSSVTPIKPKEPPGTTANNPGSTELAMLNTSMQQLIELTKKNTTAVKALNGNIMAG